MNVQSTAGRNIIETADSIRRCCRSADRKPAEISKVQVLLSDRTTVCGRRSQTPSSGADAGDCLVVMIIYLFCATSCDDYSRYRRAAVAGRHFAVMVFLDFSINNLTLDGPDHRQWALWWMTP